MSRNLRLCNGPAGGEGGGGGRGVTFRDSFGTARTQQTQDPYKWTAGASVGPQQHQQQQQQQGPAVSVHDVVKSLPKEMEIWQGSNMWPFSCFALEKDLPSLPEFLDMSPEELRLDAYNAIQQGTVDAFKRKVDQLSQEYRQKQDQIRAMPDALCQKLAQILEEGRRQKAPKGSGQSVVRPSTFGGAQTGGSSVFGTAPANTSGVFGSGGSNTSGGTPSLFGGGGGGGGGGNTSGMGGGASPFGMGGTSASAMQAPSVFGQQPSSGSLFGGGGNQATIPANSSSTASSVFGQTQPAPGLFGKPGGSGGSVFGGGGGLFAQPGGGGGVGFAQPGGGGGGGGGMFAQPGGGGGGVGATMPAPGLFGKGPAVGGGFGQPAGTGSVFGQSGGSVFGQSGGGGGLFGKPPPSSSSVFGQASTTTPTPNPAHGLFGAGPAQAGLFGAAPTTAPPPQPGLLGAAPGGGGTSSVFGNAAASAAPSVAADSGRLYTPLAQLTDLEKAQFEAKMFTPGMIPLRPPPKELINIG
ncbi:hypothetical protein ACOMHN_039398 [Nucella lapillus]